MSAPSPSLLLAPDESDVLAVVRHAAELAGVSWSTLPARSAFTSSCGEGRDPRDWASPLVQAADAVGLHLTAWTGSVREAWTRARGDLPLITMLVGPEGATTWYVVGRRGLTGIEVWTSGPDDKPERLTWKAFQRRLGEGSPDTLRAWWRVEPAAPAQELLGLPGSDLTPFGRLRALLRAERRDLGVVLVFAAGIGVLGLATPVVVQVLVNTVAFGSLLVPVLVLSLILFTCLAFAAVLRGLKRYVVEILQRRIFVRMVADLAWRLPRVRLGVFDKKHGPELVNRFFDVITVQKAASSILVDGLSAVIQAMVGLVLLAVYHPALLGFDILLLSALLVLLFGLGRNGPETAVKESKIKYQVASWLEELVVHPTVFKMAGGVELATQRADDVTHRYLDAREAHFRIFFRQYVGTLFLQVVASSALLGLGGWLVIERQLSLGQLVAAELVVTAVLSAYGKFAEKLETFYDLLAGLDKLGYLVDLPLESQVGQSLEGVGGGAVALRLEELAFAYPGAPPVLRNVELEVPAGMRLGIAGGDGQGKSVLADLLAGLRQPTGGRVLLGGLDLGAVRPHALRRETALTRGPELISGTLADNVRLGRPGFGRLDVLLALRVAGLQDKVEHLPDGIETMLAPHGAPLTQLEVLRLMVARAVLSNPRLLVVDQTLDAFEPDEASGLLQSLASPEAPWSLVVLSQHPDLIAQLPLAFRLRDGGLHPLSVVRPEEVP